MKAIYEQISDNADGALLYKQFNLPKFNAPFHYHPEVELTLILKSSGRRFVGSQISDFEAGDLVLLGENVPHCWLNTDLSRKNMVQTLHQAESTTEGIDISEHAAAQSIVIQFLPKIIGTDTAVPELKPIHQLLQSSASGILISGKTRDCVSQKMISHIEARPFRKWAVLMDILSVLLENEADLTLIDPTFSSVQPSIVQTERIQKVYAYIIENYLHDIDLNAIAAIAHLTPTAFCRYFKKITRKTLVDVITEFRIKHACQLLTSTDKPIFDICFESGFGNISYFNKTFKNSIGHSPLNYRKLFEKI